MSKAVPDSAIESRSGLPEDLKFLLEAYPRDMWRKHENMSELIRFWLARHSDFRRVMTALNKDNTGYREGRIEPQVFVQTMVPNLNMLLGALTQHHTIEDQHYFPKMQVAEPRLGKGFEMLDQDHHALHDAMDRIVETSNMFIRSQGRDERLKTGDGFADANDRLFAFLMRHLEDEEDLIVPLLLDRGEGME